ncbi:1-phosphofructokinase [Abyssisolibacter fermentans]|uniref:1-phosphofructokinase n=1 Tax=Abyssisolibacter fermentans TaxID=1766203 RepID=UPI00082AF63D|nr:1-phosphofructokinase [Abyssisolibacter fermentans]
MITTITLNVSIDRSYVLKNFDKNGVFRCEDYTIVPGGKGLNVSKVLKQLGADINCLGFVGGFSGEYVKEKLKVLGIRTNFTDIDEETRTCLGILLEDGSQAEILEKGPEIKQNELYNFMNVYKDTLKNTEVVVASGSIPKGLNNRIYYDLIMQAKKSNVKFILDSSSNTLIEGIKASPYLVKPNKEELEAITDIKIHSDEDIIKASNILIDMGAENVAVSLGEAGMIYVSKDCSYKVIVPQIEVSNPVGSGDSTVAGFAYGISNNYSIIDTLKLANTCGMSNAMQKETGKIDIEIISELVSKIKVHKI